MINELKILYKRDFNLWTERMAIAIEYRNMSEIDWENLLVEIECMGDSLKSFLENQLGKLIEYILKLQYWQEERDLNYRYWQFKVVSSRTQIKRLLKRNPSLEIYLIEVYSEIFEDTITSVRFLFEVPQNSFIEQRQIMEQDYFGDVNM